jgi:hypothetical protein
MPEYSGLKIDPFGDILVGPHMKTHGYCERHSPRPGKQTITHSSRSHSVDGAPFYFTYEICIYFTYKHKSGHSPFFGSCQCASY